VSKNSRPAWQPTNLGRRRGRTGWDPFYQFEQLARDHGKPPEPPKPSKGAVLLMEVLASKTALVVMGCVAAAVVLVLVMLLALRA
jgi:hypothetical protein